MAGHPQNLVPVVIRWDLADNTPAKRKKDGETVKTTKVSALKLALLSSMLAALIGCGGTKGGTSGGGGGGNTTPTPTATLTAVPTTITLGQSSVVTITTTNATTCVGSGSFSGSQPCNGTVTVTPTTIGTITYTVTATNTTGSISASATLTVNPLAPPTLTLTAVPTTITLGQSVALMLSNATGLTSCVGGGSLSGPEPCSGSITVVPAATGTFTYLVIGTGPGGSVTASATVTVNQAPAITTINLSCSPVTVPEGLSTQCSASVSGTGNFNPSVTWTASTGTIVSIGADAATYTAPIGATGSATISVTSSEDTTKTASYILAISIAPPSSSFQQSGPGGGDILSVVQDSSSPKTFYASVIFGGLFKSTDAGTSWKNISSNFLVKPNLASGIIEQLVVSAITGSIYARYYSSTGVSGGQIYKSTDGGGTWSQVANLPSPSNNLATQIVSDPLSDGTLYVQDSSNDWFVSRDSGSSWYAVPLPTPCGGTITPYSTIEGNLYYETCSGLYSYQSANSTWTLLSNITGINSIVAAPSDPQRIYGLTLLGIQKSMDGGHTWSNVLNAGGIGGIVVSPSNPDKIYVWASYELSNNGDYSGLIVTTDGGLTWNSLGEPHLEPHFGVFLGSLFSISSSPNVLLAEGSAHIWLTTEGSQSFAESDTGLTGNFGIQVAVDPQQPSTVYLASGNAAGVSKSIDGGKTWNPVLSGDAYAIAVDPFNSKHVLVTIDTFDPWSIYNSGLQVTYDGGITWQDAPNVIQPPSFGGPANLILFDPNTRGTIYLDCGSTYGIAKSIDGGSTWNFINNGVTMHSSSTQPLAISPSNPNILIAGTSDGIFRSSDGGVSWVSEVSSIAPVSIVFDAANPQTVYASNTELYRSTDGGQTWSFVDLGRSDIGYVTLATDPKKAGIVFAIVTSSTDQSVSVGWSPDEGTTWYWLPNSLGQISLGGNVASMVGIPVFLAATAKTTPEVLYIPSPTVGLVSLVLQH